MSLPRPLVIKIFGDVAEGIQTRIGIEMIEARAAQEIARRRATGD